MSGWMISTSTTKLCFQVAPRVPGAALLKLGKMVCGSKSTAGQRFLAGQSERAGGFLVHRLEQTIRTDEIHASPGRRFAELRNGQTVPDARRCRPVRPLIVGDDGRQIAGRPFPGGDRNDP